MEIRNFKASLFVSLRHLQTGSGAPHISSVHLVLVDIFLWIKRPGHKADYCTPFSAEVKTRGDIPPLFFPYAFMM